MKKISLTAIAIVSFLNFNIDVAKANKLVEINPRNHRISTVSNSHRGEFLTPRQQSLAKAIAQVNDSYLAQYKVSISPSRENVLEMAKLIGATVGELEFVAQRMEGNYQFSHSEN